MLTPGLKNKVFDFQVYQHMCVSLCKSFYHSSYVPNYDQSIPKKEYVLENNSISSSIENIFPT